MVLLFGLGATALKVLVEPIFVVLFSVFSFIKEPSRARIARARRRRPRARQARAAVN